MPAHRILIYGNSGSGKTTMATRVAQHAEWVIGGGRVGFDSVDEARRWI